MPIQVGGVLIWTVSGGIFNPQTYCLSPRPLFASPACYQWGLGADDHCVICTKLPRVVMIVQEGGVMGIFLRVPISPHRSYGPYFTRILEQLFFRAFLRTIV